MPNFKSISIKMAVLQGGRQNLPSPCVCYPKDPMWNRVKTIQKLDMSRALCLVVLFLLKPVFDTRFSNFHQAYS